MRDLTARFLSKDLSRRHFIRNLTALGFTASAAAALVQPLETLAAGEPAAPTTGASKGAGHGAAVAQESLAGAQQVQGTGGELFAAQARAAGIEFLFTNPGSFERALFDALVEDPKIHLIEGLHEGVVIAMADGYHKVSGRPSLVNVHAIAGVAAVSGQLYNASRDGSAVVVTAGMVDNESWSDEALLAARPGFDQKDVNRQFTKISWDTREPASLALMLRRALKVAVTEPGGPTYLGTARGALEAKNVSAAVLPAERFLSRTRVNPDRSSVERVARWLVHAKRPVIIAGDEVWKSSAQGELLALAERLGVPVSATPSGLDFNAFENFPTQHALRLDKWQSSGYAQGGIDLVLFVGARDEGKAGIPSAPELPPGARIVRLGMDTASHGRNYGTDEALVGDVRAGLTDLRAAVESLVTQERRAAIAGERTEEITRATRGRGAENEKAVAATLGKSPVHPHEVGRILAETVDRNAIIVSENLCGKYDSFRFGFREDEHMWLGTSGVALGWSIGAATGAKLAAPDRQVVCCVGDGSAMYSAAGFWSQARYRVPVLTVVWNNRSYQFVRWLYHRYGGKMAASAKYPAVYLGDPDIDFVKLAGSQGVAGERVDSGRALRAAMKRGLAATSGGAPYLIEVVVAPYGDGADSKWHGSYDLSARAKRRS